MRSNPYTPKSACQYKNHHTLLSGEAKKQSLRHLIWKLPVIGTTWPVSGAVMRTPPQSQVKLNVPYIPLTWSLNWLHVSIPFWGWYWMGMYSETSGPSKKLAMTFTGSRDNSRRWWSDMIDQVLWYQYNWKLYSMCWRRLFFLHFWCTKIEIIASTFREVACCPAELFKIMLSSFHHIMLSF